MVSPYFHGCVRLTLSICRYSKSAALIAICCAAGQLQKVLGSMSANRGSMAWGFEPLNLWTVASHTSHCPVRLISQVNFTAQKSLSALILSSVSSHAAYGGPSRWRQDPRANIIQSWPFVDRVSGSIITTFDKSTWLPLARFKHWLVLTPFPRHRSDEVFLNNDSSPSGSCSHSRSISWKGNCGCVKQMMTSFGTLTLLVDYCRHIKSLKLILHLIPTPRCPPLLILTRLKRKTMSTLCKRR